jgi:hypothetical protein
VDCYADFTLDLVMSRDGQELESVIEIVGGRLEVGGRLSDWSCWKASWVKVRGSE